jgi:PAS domain S-box-containing protein
VSHPHDLVRRSAVPLVVLVTGALATGAVTYGVHQMIEAQDRLRFDASAERIHDSIRDRIEMYVAMLRAGAGLFSASDFVSDEEFHAFVERLELQERYPGVQGIGYSARIPAEQLDDEIAAQQRRGRAGFTVWPAAARSEYHSILYLEPLDARNQAAIGYDMFTEPTRRNAMERARDSGSPAASGLVTLVQEIDEQKQPGFLIYMPVYAGGGTPASVAERRTRLRGFVYSPFRAGDLFAGILGRSPLQRAGFALFDGAPSEQSLVHRTGVPSERRSFIATRTVNVAGREWTVAVFATPGLDVTSSLGLVTLIGWGGALLTLLLTGLVWLQARARERAERSEAAAADASARFQQLANSIPQLAWTANSDGWIYWYNERWYEYTGTTPEQMAGWGWQTVHHPDVLPTVLERWKQSLAMGEPLEIEFPLRGADGTFQLFLTRVVPFRDASGAIVQWFGTNTNVQYRHDAERALREQAETLNVVNQRVQQLLDSERGARLEVERQSRMKDEFLAILSHELRTPLNAVMGWAHMLSASGLSEDKRQQAIDTILRNAQAQSRLIEDLLDMSRIISGRLSLRLGVVNLQDVVEAAVNVVRPTAAARGVALAVAVESPPPHDVCGDPGRLQQVVLNLLTNAIKFTAAGGRVDVRLSRTRDAFEVSVQDTGVGIAPEFLPHVFDRFRQADSSFTRGHGGLGLGLSITRSLIEMHGGTIGAASDGAGRGATFSISVPAAPQSSAGQARALENGQNPHVLPASLRNLSVLIVEDDEDARELAREVLSQHGARVVHARSGVDALNLIDSDAAFDLIVSDVGMPGMDGYEFIRQVRQRAGGDRRTRAIAVTAYAGAEDQRRALAAGFDRHMAKPISPDQLVAACASLMASALDHP